MPWWTDALTRAAPRRGARLGPSVARWAVALALLIHCLLAGVASAQQEPAAEVLRLESLATQAEVALTDPETETAALEDLRARLVAARSDAMEIQRALQPSVDRIDARLRALGPPPEEGASEPDDIAERRAALEAERAVAHAPLLAAEDAYQRAAGQIAEIDRQLVERATRRLFARGPSPLDPNAWRETADQSADALRGYAAAVTGALADPEARAHILRRLPIGILLTLAGIAVAFTLRRHLGEWIAARLAETRDSRTIAWLGVLRNINRLILPAVGAGLLFAALEPDTLVGPREQVQLFRLPVFVWILIGTGWLRDSLFGARADAGSVVPVRSAEARHGARIVLALGVLLAVESLLRAAVVAWDLTPGAAATLYFPLILLGALSLWHALRLIRRYRLNLSGHDPRGIVEDIRLRLPISLLRLGEIALRAVVLLGPVLAALGYLALAEFLTFRAMLTLGLFGAALVVYDLLRTTLASLFPGRTDTARDPGQQGVVPVATGAVVTLVTLPLLALIWGARPVDIVDLWRLLHEGFSIGGIRISLGVVIRFAVAFAVALAITRLLQSVLRAYVLPSTRLDSGGQYALVAGVGYTGFALAALVGVSAAGLDLTSLAIVAGALSVGIGFGLQNVVSNFVSGIILLIERPIKEGDWIEVAGFEGTVRGIRARSTEIETFDRASVIVPNSDLVSGTVLNRTHIGLSGRLIVPVRVAYDSDPRHVERVLMEIAENQPIVLEEPPPSVLFSGFGADGMEFEIRCRLRDVNYGLTVQSDMNFEIVERFRAEGIVIPVPQRDLRLRGDTGKAGLAPPPGDDTHGA